MAARLVEAGHVGPGFTEAVLARERTYPTGLPTAIGTAIPHTDPEHVIHPGLAVVTLKWPVPFGEMGGSGQRTVNVSLVVMLVLKGAHSQVLALQQLMACLQDVEGVQGLLDASDDAELRERAEVWLG